jgi:hypothetical protein
MHTCTCTNQRTIKNIYISVTLYYICKNLKVKKPRRVARISENDHYIND